jgi:hypothetical protein
VGIRRRIGPNESSRRGIQTSDLRPWYDRERVVTNLAKGGALCRKFAAGGGASEICARVLPSRLAVAAGGCTVTLTWEPRFTVE